LRLVGYNAAQYDAPLLAAELRRASARLRSLDASVADKAATLAAWLLDAPWADPLAVRRRAEPMTLAGSVGRYLGAPLEGARSAGVDASATLLILGAQFATGHAADVADAVVPPDRPTLDRAGKLLLDEGAAPTPQTVRYSFGSKAKGKTIAEDPGFA